MIPQTMTLIIATFPAERCGAGPLGAVADLATIAGPLLGGLLVSTAGWWRISSLTSRSF